MLKSSSASASPPAPQDHPQPQPGPAEGTPESSESLAAEAEQLCAALDRVARKALGEMPAAADLAEVRAQQAALRDLVRRATESGGSARVQVAELAAERDKLKDAVARARADFLNYQSRAGKDLERAEEGALRGYMAELLPVLDSLDLTCKDAASHAPDAKRLKEALDLIGGSMHQALKVRGLERIEVLGSPFDPLQHEPVATRPPDPAKGEKAGQVVEELRPGYLWKGKVLRAAQVLITK